MKPDEFGNTLDIKGTVHYQGSRDELNEKLRQRDDEIDRLRRNNKALLEIIQHISKDEIKDIPAYLLGQLA